jgi:L-lactate dehydrogenase (cytochrome)
VTRIIKSGIDADIAVLEGEICTAMQLMGVTKLDELKPEMIDCLRAL